MSRFEKMYGHFIQFEWILFYFLVLLNALPAVQLSFFHTVDGPTHLYNSNIILQLVSSKSEFLSQYYSFNSWLVPNWIGHFLMALLLSVFSGATASKIFIALCLILLPLSFRYCVKKINPEALFATYLIFPFTYTFVLCMGFYNFYLGVVVLFTTMGVLIDYQKSNGNPVLIAKLFLLIILCYLSHLFAFVSITLVAFFTSLPLILQVIFNKEQFKALLKKLGGLLFVFCVPLLLTLNFFSHSKSATNKVYPLSTELIQWLTNCRSIIWYVPEHEGLYSTFVFLIIMCLFSLALYFRGRQFQRALSSRPFTVRGLFTAFHFQDAFLLISAAFVFLYFKLPDSDSFAGFVSLRLNLLFFLFLIVWCSGFNYPRWISTVSFIVLFFSQVSLLLLHKTPLENLQNTVTEIEVIETYLEENSVILPLNFSENWLTKQNSNYLGINKAVMILENHECNNSYFPLKWKNAGVMGDYTASNESRLNQFLRNSSPEVVTEIDYVFVQDKNAMPKNILDEILESFTLKKETNSLLLFENKLRLTAGD